MFRTLRESLDRRHTTLVYRQKAEKSLKEVVGDVIRETYKEIDLSSIGVSFEPQQGVVVITTKSKAMASQLLLQVGYLAASIRQQKMKVTRIVIR